jgi:hypothetical protein
MKTNESGLDRIIRVALGILLVTLYATGVVGGGFGIILTVLGGILIITGAVGFCPLYSIFKLRTNK